ncbi:AmmeMemoRadiSam system protein A [Pichia kudriavzevii]|uniref:AMME syndrome candidate gene 1 protein n=1 Tax=Pichia kudriavzevii TaxID=4909 RepID=A0A1V2LGT0_PICKU|nr:AMME syndrome candidate gene 1 protein [Pichia kudriavzevii]OUT23476.1 AmmeMemoRadiSam system protein A [Pichia kudriavzevii]
MSTLVTKQLCNKYAEYATKVLYSELTKTSPPPPPSPLSLSSGQDQDHHPLKCPLFVTWNKNGNLRGCIGTFAPQSLPDGVRKYALIAALDDPRFPPITKDELPHLECHVTLLHSFEDITSSPLDWQVGVHGVHISFSKRGRHYSATFLPQVAPEQGWTKEETMDQLLAKAGYPGSWHAVVNDLQQLNVERYRGEIGHFSSL